MQARSWRHEIFPEYKGKRSPPPEPFVDAQPVVQELLDALGLPWVQITSIEADDVIATLATVGAGAGLRTAIVSPDKDFQQVRMLRALGAQGCMRHVPDTLARSVSFWVRKCTCCVRRGASAAFSPPHRCRTSSPSPRTTFGSAPAAWSPTRCVYQARQRHSVAQLTHVCLLRSLWTFLHSWATP